MLRMSADDNTHNHTTTAPSLSSPCTYFISISLFPSFYSSLSSYLIPLFPKAFFLPPVPFLRIPPSFILHYSNFSEQRNEAGVLSSFQTQNHGVTGGTSYHILSFENFSVLHPYAIHPHLFSHVTLKCSIVISVDQKLIIRGLWNSGVHFFSGRMLYSPETEFNNIKTVQ